MKIFEKMWKKNPVKILTKDENQKSITAAVCCEKML